MMATGLGSFVKGAFEGYQGVKDIQRKEALQKREDERFAMEQERFAAEKERAARELKQQQEADKYKQEAISILEEQKTGTGRFAEYADPNAVAARQQAAQSIEQKGAASYDRAEARRLGRTIDETQTASVTPEEDSIFKQGGEGLYKDQQTVDNLKYKMIGDVMKKSLINKGDFGAAMLVDRDINKMAEEGYDLQRKKAAAYVAAGAPPATVVASLKKVYGFIDDGKTIDETQSTYDPKTRSYTLAFVDQKTGAVEKRPVDQMSMLTTLKQLDPVKILEFNMNSDRRAEDLAREDARRKEDVKLKERELGIKEKEAGATLAFRGAQMAALQDQVKGADVKAKIEGIEKSFPLADKVFKPEDMLGKKPDEVATLQASVQRDTTARNVAVNLTSLNPKIDPRIIIGAAKSAAGGGSLTKKQEENTGRSYFTYGGVNIYLN
jgi:hypothetical protein